ncbi:MAG: gliding motility-associated C-terminal domain-containing protein, partial [Bacteroidota bacterium]
TSNVCGATTSTEVSCPANDCPTFNINITPIDDICLTASNTPIMLEATASGGVGGGTFSWSGPGVVANQFLPSMAGPQVITVTYTEDNCSQDESITVNVFDTPNATFTVAPVPVCTDQETTVTYTGTASVGATYTWNFAGGTAVPGTGQGPHTVSWPTGGPKDISLTVSENGCTSGTETQTITVEEPLAAPVINCSPNTTQIVFSWNDIAGATGYQVNVISAPGGAMTSLDETNRTFTVTGLMAGDIVEIEVIAVGNGPCGNSSNTFTCQAQDCPDITVEIDAVPAICFEMGLPDITLTATVTGGAGTGTFTWAGDGITDPIAGTFSIDDASVGPAAVTVSYREDGCDYVDDIVIDIFAIPTADFTVTTPICVTDSTTVLYTGSGSNMADYAWDFGGGVAVPGTGQGPHRVIWPTDGDQTISLIVTENGCSSPAFTQTVTVAPELIAPMISCDVTGDSIIFTWPDVAGATGYTVNIIDAPANAFATGGDPDRTFTMAGFTPGQPATIAVTAISGTACPDITFEGTCSLDNCPDITIDIDDVAPICLDASAMAFDLNAVITGNTAGVLSWSGTGITDPAQGTFDPLATGAGNFAIIATYEEMSCFYADTTLVIVNAQPSASFTATGPICEDDISIVTYTGGASAMASYDWNFGNGTIVSGSDAGPYEINFADGGNQTISLTVTENGCASDPFSTTVEVIDSLVAPIISCTADNTSITFSWNAVAGATGYMVNVIDAPAGAMETPDLANRMYTFSNLAPEDMATIEVIVVTDNICGGVSSTQTCSSEPCPERSFGTDGYGPFCDDAGVQMLVPVITGGNLTGMISWSGDGIVSANGMFDPAVANLGDNLVTLSYEQTGCFYDTTYTVVVNPKPVADFTVTSPICVTDVSLITFTGTAGASATYDWVFDGGTVISGTGVGPYEIMWDTPGDKTITLTVTENGCVSDPATGTVRVDAEIPPVVISCSDATTSSVTFSWDPVAGADTYTVTVIQPAVTGTQDGNTYTINSLTDGEEVIIEVTASGPSVCGSSTAQGTCNALTCQPLSLTLDGPAVICEGDDTALTINITGGQGTPVTIDYTVNGVAAQLTGINDGDQIQLPNVTEESTVVITGVSDEVNTNCVYDPMTEFTVPVDPQVSAGLDGLIDPVCPDDATVVDLGAALSGADAGGSWTETSGSPSTGGAFQAGAGTFNAQSQASGTYTFEYTIDGGACPDDSAVVSFTINQEPVADAGLDQILTCNMGMVALGGNSSAGATYTWTSDNPDAMITDPDAPLIDVSAPGTYTIEVTNAAGCVATDQVVVNSDFDVPVADVSISEVSCFEAADGAIIINTVVGGTPPYSFSLNGSAPTTNTFFGNLSGNMYTLIITDANGCFTELGLELIEPTQVAVTLTTSLENNDNDIELGESVTLQALYDPNIPIDTIIWQPDSIGVPGQNAVEVSPTETTTYSVTITDINGCSDSDNMTIIVRKQRPVYVPTAFSPDGDNTNDFLFPQGGDEITEIKSFLVFNRWGEAVFENYDFQPNIPTEGWDGRFRGQLMNSAVFVYYLEVEFIDGETELFKGDVVLMR